MKISAYRIITNQIEMMKKFNQTNQIRTKITSNTEWLSTTKFSCSAKKRTRMKQTNEK
jgi:hypothetical protein